MSFDLVRSEMMLIVYQALFFIYFIFNFIINIITQSPFLFFEIACSALLIYIYFKPNISGVWKVVVFNLAVIMLIFSFFEVAFIFKDKFSAPNETGRVLYRPDDVRGYCPLSDQRSSSKYVQNGKTVYDVIYRTNRFGLRVSPHDIHPIVAGTRTRHVLFFGCSFTFGIGVNDNEALPFVFENNSRGKYWAYNFGLPGGGPHQMLALLKSGIVPQVLNGQRPVAAVYSALPCHIQRAALKDYHLSHHVNWFYGNLGPKYYLGPSNQLLLRKKGEIGSLNVMDMLNKSSLFSNFLSLSRDVRNEADRKLFIEIVKSSKEAFESRYGGKFYVIYWDLGEADDQLTIEALRREGIDVIPVSDILPEYKKNPEKYHLKEGHPNKFAYQMIAQYLLNKDL